jgi:FkbM family methyltransferase
VRVVHLEGTPDAWNFRRFARDCADLGVKPRHVLHVGGHLGQEIDHYRAAGVERVTYMEPNPASAAHLRTLGDDVRVIEAAAGATRGEATLSLCGGDGAWDTLRPEVGTGAGVHQPEGGVRVAVVPIRDVQDDADVLVVDTQGTELDALKSASLCSCAPALSLVVVETQSSGHPEAAHIDDVSAFMALEGWQAVFAWNHEYANRPHATFADVFYLPVAAPGRSEWCRGS